MATTTVFILSLYTMTITGLFIFFALCLVHDDVSEHHWCGIPVNRVMLQEVQEAVLWPRQMQCKAQRWQKRFSQEPCDWHFWYLLIQGSL